MDLEASLSYPKPPAAVFAMLSDPSFVERKAAATGALHHETGVQLVPDGGATITCHRTMPAVVPDFVRSFVGETIEIKQTDVWEAADADGSRAGSFTADVTGAPVSIRAKMSLHAAGTGTEQRVTASVKASVPFVGGKIEKSVGEAIMAAVRKEEEVGRAWLAEG